MVVNQIECLVFASCTCGGVSIYIYIYIYTFIFFTITDVTTRHIRLNGHAITMTS